MPAGETGIYQAMANVMTKIKPIAKEKENKEQHFKFRGIDDVYNMIQSIMAEEGIFCLISVLPELCVEKEKVSARGNSATHRVDYYEIVFAHKDGSRIAVIQKGEAIDYADKSSGKTLSMAHKVTLLSTFMIPVDNMDDQDKDDGEEKKFIPQGQKAPRPQAPAQPKAPAMASQGQKDGLLKLYRELNPSKTVEECNTELQAMLQAKFNHAPEQTTSQEMGQLWNELSKKAKQSKQE